MNRTQEIARYSVGSTLWLGASGGATYLRYPVVVYGAPHELVVVLSVLSAAAFIGGYFCDRWRMFTAPLRWVRDLIRRILVFLAIADPLLLKVEGPTRDASTSDRVLRTLAAFASRQDAFERRIAQLQAQLEVAAKEAERNAATIEQLKREIWEARSLTVRDVTGGVLGVVGILLALAATVSGAVGG